MVRADASEAGLPGPRDDRSQSNKVYIKTGAWGSQAERVTGVVTDRST